MKQLAGTIILLFLFCNSYSQNFIISGKLIESESGKPIPNATVYLQGSNIGTMSKADGSFRLHSESWHDTLEITSIGFEEYKLPLVKFKTQNLIVQMKNKSRSLQTVLIDLPKKPGKTFMQKVIEQKQFNNPSRFKSYSYRQYSRHELDIDNIDYTKNKGNGIKALLLNTYSGLDPSAKFDKELPIYFSETLADNYHSVAPNIEQENIIAKKTLGLKTDEILRKLDKFQFNFNVYDDWLSVFDQTYVSPLNSNAFSYYKFFEGDSISEDGYTLLEIRFIPLRAYERAFSGTLWINKTTYGVESLDMHLSKTANLNFVSDIAYTEDYQLVYDSTTERMAYMPFKYSSDVKFETGLQLLGIPVPDNNNSVKLIIKNTTVISRLNLDRSTGEATILKKEQTADWNKPEIFWKQNRLDSLTTHEKNIYKLVDSLKKIRRFRRDTKLAAFMGTGYWDFGNALRIGHVSSVISRNRLEGWRIRLGFWTMQGISKKLNINGYAAYGTKDHQWKGLFGLKYVWNDAQWTKTSLSFGSDYDFIIDHDDEMDKDNIINSMFRKKVPYARTFIQEVLLKHEQYLSSNFSSNAALLYKELNPVFDFKYHPMNRNDRRWDTTWAKKLPVVESRIGLRYAHKEGTSVYNYDQIKLGTYYPVLTLNYTYGFETLNTQFEYHKLNFGIEQRLRLPPKSFFYYKIETGKVFGTLPYLLLNIPEGNEYYVTSKYLFNTMIPYEFAADRYVSLHTRFYLGGALFDKIPFLRKLGWRERFAYNSYWGDMTKDNIRYNKNSKFHRTGNTPFMEAGAGIENIFHFISIEYYRRLTHLRSARIHRDGIYVGVSATF